MCKATHLTVHTQDTLSEAARSSTPHSLVHHWTSRRQAEQDLSPTSSNQGPTHHASKTKHATGDKCNFSRISNRRKHHKDRITFCATMLREDGTQEEASLDSQEAAQIKSSHRSHSTREQNAQRLRFAAHSLPSSS
ncbi:hypothetical protein Nepgr_033593 [Nepenthes gracilis]|uniref:Uncharacterized protein n=1 Tax=Nepenthes gracilis TaxID=150966 RepID=A0AAD3TM45_NEPGR|nr:hypothetical protein Nepgr_033593 [Nepenthes gracilis]